MPKSEHKSEPGLPHKSLSRLAQQEPQSGDDGGFHQSLLLVLLVVLLTIIIVPKGVLTPVEFSPGDIAPRDIKAPRDLLIPDEDLSEQKRNDAEKSVASLYDYDPATGLMISEQVGQILASLRAGQDLEVTDEQQIAELESSFGIKTKNKGFTALKELANNDGIKAQVSLIMKQLYRQKIAQLWLSSN